MITPAEQLAVNDGIEAVWDTWLASLQTWDLRTVLKHELEWHDLFVSGEWSWADLIEAVEEEQAL